MLTDDELVAHLPEPPTHPAAQRPAPPAGRGQGQGRLASVPRIAAFLMTALALLTAAAAISVVARRGVEPVRSLIASLVIPAPANLAYSAFAAAIAAASARRKRVAYWILLFFMGVQLLNGIAATVALFVDPSSVELDPGTSVLDAKIVVGVIVALQAGAVAVLIAARHQFYARVQRAAVRKALGVYLLGLLCAAGLGGLAVAIAPGSLRTPGDKIGWTLDKITGGAFTLDFTTGRAPGWVNLLLGGLGAIAFFLGLSALLRSQRAASVLQPEEERSLRELLAASGEDDSLGYFATRRDKAAVFSPSGKAAITYRVVLGVSLASGDPVGDPEAWGPAIAAWLGQARAYAWIPAVMGASEHGATAYVRAGLRALEIGDEAVLHTETFDLDSREMRGIRQGVSRLARAGFTVRVRRHGQIPPGELDQVSRLADAWRVGDTERGFSMALSRLGDPADGRCVLVEALDARQRTVALLSFVPWGSRGLSLDLMRRDRGAENGLTELMVAELARRAGSLGVSRISLNFAVFRSAFEDGARIGAGPIARAWRRVLLLASRWFQLESLYRANAKYRPEWVPRFLCFAERRELVKISLASVVAEGFLTLPGGRGRRLSPVAIPHATPESKAPAKVAAPGEQLPEQVRTRLSKLERIRACGGDPYPVGYPRTAGCAQISTAHAGLAPGEHTGSTAGIAGRVMRVRDHGGVVFVLLRDWTGDLQVILSAQSTGEDAVARFTHDVDLGDHIGVSGEIVASRRGEVSIEATSWTLTAKCLRPLPDKHSGLGDAEARVRQRYVDLIVRPEARSLLRARSAVVAALRSSLTARGFLEVETPQLQPIHGGAAARPFTTHLAALDLPLYLRIAPELYLKRLCVGGVERVFELGRTFRNEGMSYKHNPEFTMLEAYQAYADYRVMLDLVRELIQEAATAAHGSPVAFADRPDGGRVEHDLSGPWPVLSVHEAISSALGEPVDADTGAEQLRRLCARGGVATQASWSRGALVLELYERLVEARTRAPTFYLDFPLEVSPLTRQHRGDPRLAERWDLVAFGSEIATAYSELVDPVEQRRRLTAQSLLAAGGDPEAMQLDEDFLTALEYAMPPSGGLGLGVDRLVMMLTGRSIRETLAFPLVRVRGGHRSGDH